MSVAISAPPDYIRIHRAPPLDPPCDDEWDSATTSDGPAGRAKASAAHRTWASSTQPSSAEASGTQPSSAEASGTQASSAEASGAQASSTQVSSAEASGTQASGTQAGGAPVRGPAPLRAALLPLPPRVWPPEALAGASAACHTAALRFLNVLLELLNGYRSQRQMQPLLHVEYALTVLDELARVAHHVNDLRKRRAGGRVRRTGLRICEPRPGVAEAAAVLNDGDRTWAVCYRLERVANVWRCAFLRAALPPRHPPMRSRPPRRRPAPVAASPPRA